MQSKARDASQFHCVAPFPWNQDSLSRLYDASSEKIEELQPKWKAAVDPWLGSVMVGADGCAYIFRKALPPLCIKIPRLQVDGVSGTRSYTSYMVLNLPQNKGHLDSNVKCIAWALEPTSWTNPVVILAACRMVFIYEPTSHALLGSLRGHGAVSTLNISAYETGE